MDTITTKTLDAKKIFTTSPGYGTKWVKKEHVSRCKTCKCEVQNGAVQCTKCLYGE